MNFKIRNNQKQIHKITNLMKMNLKHHKRIIKIRIQKHNQLSKHKYIKIFLKGILKIQKLGKNLILIFLILKPFYLNF